MTLTKEQKTVFEKVIRDIGGDAVTIFNKYKDKLETKQDLASMFAEMKKKLSKSDIEKISAAVVALFKGKEKNGLNACQPPLAPGKYTFDDIAGQKRLKNDISVNYIYPFEFPLLFRKKGNILLYGPPGVGKSFTVRAATATLSKVAFFAPSAGELRGKYEGDTEKNIDLVFKCAHDTIDGKNYTHAVIFLDEFDAIGGSGRDENQSLNRSVNSLLAAMDGIKSFPNVSVMAATNYPWNVDEALLRRFNVKIFVDLPDADARLFLIKQVLLENYYFPGVESEDKRKNIFAKDSGFTPYILLSNYGKSNVDAKFFKDLATRMGPTKDGLAVKNNIESGRKIKEDLDESPSMFGYSGSDITNLMTIAVQKASLRAMSGQFRKEKISDKEYWLHDPKLKENEGTKILSIPEDERNTIINFTLYKEDVDKAMEEYKPSISNEKYAKVYEYYKKNHK